MPGYSRVHRSAYGDGIVGHAAVNASSAGANVIVTGEPGKLIMGRAYLLMAPSAVAAQWESSGGAVLSGALPFAANGGCSVPDCVDGHFVTDEGEDLVLNLGGAVLVTGHITFDRVEA